MDTYIKDNHGYTHQTPKAKRRRLMPSINDMGWMTKVASIVAEWN
jgi:hypothetical protein